MSQSPRLIHTGSVIVDVVLSIDHIPPPGGDILATTFDETAGGGLNVIVAALRDELPVLFTGRYGSGRYGEIVRQALESCGAELVNSASEEQDSGFCIALVDAQAERTFVTYPGIEADMRPSDLSVASVQPTDLVYITGYSLAHPISAASLIDWLPSLPPAAVVCFDPSPLIDTLNSAVVDAVLRRANIVTTNRREGLLMTGESAPDAMAGRLNKRMGSSATAIVRDGSSGCWIASASGVRLIPGFPVDAVDTNGAGDAHTGVLLAGLSRGMRVGDSAMRANAAAAIAVTGRGPATAPMRVETDNLALRACE